MNRSVSPEPHRLYFFDSIRYIAIIGVVLFHVAVGYAPGAPEFFREATTADGLWSVRNTIVAFIMLVLFFVAGYFALPSLQGRSHWAFFGRKLRRLGWPWLVGVLFLGPLMPYLGYYSQSFIGLESPGYLSFWWRYISSGFTTLQLRAAFTANPQFHHQHFWFLMALLEIFAAFALGHAAWHRWGPPSRAAGRATSADTAAPVSADVTADAGGSTPGRSADLTLGAGLVLIGVLSWLVDWLDLPRGQFFFFFYFSSRMVVEYGGTFLLGVLAYHRRWYRGRPGPGLRLLLSLTVAWVVFHFLQPVMEELRIEALPPRTLWVFWYVFHKIRVGWWLVALCLVTRRFLNRDTRAHDVLAANSYSVYLLQYPVILVLRLLMLGLDWNAWVKFTIASLGTIALCYLIGEYLIRRAPRRAVATALVLHLLVCAFGLPATDQSHLLLARRDALGQVVPLERPMRLALRPEQPDDDVDGYSYATPVAALTRGEDARLVAFRPGGVYALSDANELEPLNLDLDLLDVVQLDRGMAGIDDQTRMLVILDDRAQVQATAVDSSDSTGSLLRLAADGAGGVYFVTERERRRGGDRDAGTGVTVWHWSTRSGLRQALVADSLKAPTAIGADLERQRVLLGTGSSAHIWSAAILADGRLGPPEPVAELFLADSRYGSERAMPPLVTVVDLAADPAGRLYAATDFGVQVFTAAGEFLGVVTFPDVPIDTMPKYPRNLLLDSDARHLIVACGDEIYSVELAAGP